MVDLAIENGRECCGACNACNVLLFLLFSKVLQNWYFHAHGAMWNVVQGIASHCPCGNAVTGYSVTLLVLPSMWYSPNE